VKFSLIDEYVKKPSAHGMSTFNGSSVYYGLCKISWKNSKTLHSDCSGDIEDEQNHEQKKVKKVKDQDSMGKRNLFLSILPFSSWTVCRSSSKNTRKMNLKPALIKTLPRAHTELEFDVLGIPRKLVKYEVYSSKRKYWKKIKFFT
jgi:hypothetical protein